MTSPTRAALRAVQIKGNGKAKNMSPFDQGKERKGACASLFSLMDGLWTFRNFGQVTNPARGRHVAIATP
jgi:hypothetical protein